MNEHNISVTIVELDPLVYKYAREYFGLHRLQLKIGPPEARSFVIDNSEPSSGKDGEIYLEDARKWVRRKAQALVRGLPIKDGNRKLEKYDYVIHDVFSGGSVPSHLFTMEFWSELKVLLRNNGVLAVVCHVWTSFDSLLMTFLELRWSSWATGFESNFPYFTEEFP
jgi:spermidine synthase